MLGTLDQVLILNSDIIDSIKVVVRRFIFRKLNVTIMIFEAYSVSFSDFG